MLPFTTEEAWLDRHPGDNASVHLEQFPDVPAGLARRGAGREVGQGAPRAPRRHRRAGDRARGKRIGSSLEAAPVVHITDPDLLAALDGLDLAEICITSQIAVSAEPAPADAFRLDDVAGVAVVPRRAEGRKCARSWRIPPDVGSDPDYPDLARDAAALREIEALRAAVA